MMLLSVNVGQPKAVEFDGRRYETGIYKSAWMGQVWLRRDGVEGDEQADKKHHGGEHQAVYCYAHENYSHWAQRLARRDFIYGQFGENLTTLGLLESEARIGDIYRVVGALIQASQPRVPCYKLANKLGVPGFEAIFLRANRSGFYARVLEEGLVKAGDPIALISKDPVGMTVAEVNAALYLELQPAAAERALRIKALSPGWKRSFEKLLAKA